MACIVHPSTTPVSMVQVRIPLQWGLVFKLLVSIVPEMNRSSTISKHRHVLFVFARGATKLVGGCHVLFVFARGATKLVGGCHS
jgi:hypothetical protein